jgi:hypothetical protein
MVYFCCCCSARVRRRGANERTHNKYFWRFYFYHNFFCPCACCTYNLLIVAIIIKQIGHFPFHRYNMSISIAKTIHLEKLIEGMRESMTEVMTVVKEHAGHIRELFQTTSSSSSKAGLPIIIRRNEQCTVILMHLFTMYV